MKKNVDKLIEEIQNLPKKNLDEHTKYYKMQKGCYAAHDKFRGITNPQLHHLTKKYCEKLSLDDVEELIQSVYNEDRLLALLLLIRFKEKKIYALDEVIAFYMHHVSGINNWNLVDASAYKLLGEHLLHKDKGILFTLAKSTNLWERRIAIVTTLFFIKNNVYDITFEIITLLINDSEDLIHKACGWMLREIGKKDKQALTNFLDLKKDQLPRISLRYALEHFSQEEKKKYFSTKINKLNA